MSALGGMLPLENDLGDRFWPLPEGPLLRGHRLKLPLSQTRLRTVSDPAPHVALRRVSGWVKAQRQAVHAIAQTGRLGTVVEDMAQMAAAAAA